MRKTKIGQPRGFFVLFACAFLVVSVFCVNPSYALIIEQNTNNGSLQVQDYEPLGQSFTATDTDIGYVGLNIEPYNQWFNDLTLTMSLYSDAGDFSPGALLTSNSFTLAEGYSGWLNLDVSTPLGSSMIPHNGVSQ